MKYAALLSLVLAGSFAQSSKSKAPEDATLPNGRRWSEAIAEADYKDNVRDSRALADLSAEIRDEIGVSDKFVLSLKTLRKLEDAEKLVKDMRNRMRKN